MITKSFIKQKRFNSFFKLRFALMPATEFIGGIEMEMVRVAIVKTFFV